MADADPRRGQPFAVHRSEHDEVAPEAVAGKALGELDDLALGPTGAHVGHDAGKPERAVHERSPDSARRAPTAPAEPESVGAASASASWPIVWTSSRPAARSAATSARIWSSAPSIARRSGARLNGWNQRWKTAHSWTARPTPRAALR